MRSRLPCVLNHTAHWQPSFHLQRHVSPARAGVFTSRPNASYPNRAFTSKRNLVNNRIQLTTGHCPRQGTAGDKKFQKKYYKSTGRVPKDNRIQSKPSFKLHWETALTETFSPAKDTTSKAQAPVQTQRTLVRRDNTI